MLRSKAPGANPRKTSRPPQLPISPGMMVSVVNLFQRCSFLMQFPYSTDSYWADQGVLPVSTQKLSGLDTNNCSFSLHFSGEVLPGWRSPVRELTDQ